MTFLQQTAQRIFETHGPSLRDVWVILPTRRAVSVFLDELAALSDRPFLAPHALAVDDFITQAAGVQLIDSVSLLFELYEVFKEIDPAVEFEQFIGWASVLVADFDRIDQYLIDPGELFSYLTAAKALERWQVTSPKPITETPGTARYFKLFENLHTAYNTLHRRLAEQGLAYRGLAYRLLAQNVDTQIRDNWAYERIYFVGFNALSRAEEHIIRVLVDAQKAELIWDADQYYVQDKGQEAGEFMRRYRDYGWFSAKLEGKNKFDQLSNNLLRIEKNIRIVGVPNASMQAKVAGKIYSEWQRQSIIDSHQSSANFQPLATSDYRPSTKKTAIVLADETLLVPVLYALDENVTDLNVTMGLSLRSSLLFTLVDTLFEMQRTVHEFRAKDGRDVRVPKFHHRHVVKLLNHPFLKQYERIKGLMWPGERTNEGVVLPPEPLFQWIAKDIVQQQRVYLSENELWELGQNDPLIRTLFTRWSNEEPMQAIQAFYDLIELLRDVYRTSQDAIEIEYLYLFFTLLKQLESTLIRGHEHRGKGMGHGVNNSEPQSSAPSPLPHAQVTVRSLRQFLYELIRQTSIPFTSEGKSQLQIMGMLETRALDFERVIVLSVNEGILPQAKKLNSLIPFDIATEIKLPTYREQEAVMAYHFYRLLQRANEVVLLYTTATDAYGNSKGEPSRFIRQIEHELVNKAKEHSKWLKEKLKEKGKFAEAELVKDVPITLTKPTVRFGNSGADKIKPLTELSVPKTESIQKRLIDLLTTRGLYPSYLNQFVSCSMRFYFSRIVNIGEEEDIEEKMGAAEFGSWLHKVMERLDLEYRLKELPIDESIIRNLLNEEFAQTMKGRVIESGMNLLLYELAQKLMLDFQRQQNRLEGLTVIGTEQTLEAFLNVPVAGGGSVRVRIAGKVDRIERYGGQIRIVDYKTGKVSLPEKTPADLAPKLLSDGGDVYSKMRQLWLYRYLTLKNISEFGGLPRDKSKRNIFPTAGLPVEAGFYSFRDVNGGFKSNPVRFDDNDDPEQYIRHSEELLQELIRQLLDPELPFRKTDQIELCQYCDFKGICGR
ncbi:PD-(D/E)XK nuclease family protein [Spirosoma sp. BT702]|uniref:PD-(D/E)XK nuclease family protein n=1 Tax=Spirosoma profusum TaxID=2771354 RepID=A0A926Y0B4_9BACT|nr:PD-(D/E)XK nuclease family protein [Spirosoma profusum]MBD2704243.1 PD-(D/E)XK nuclease family protein [Spirosoma profusum]